MDLRTVTLCCTILSEIRAVVGGCHFVDCHVLLCRCCLLWSSIVVGVNVGVGVGIGLMDSLRCVLVIGRPVGVGVSL